MQALSTRPVFRFAPSPNGLLHLGHAYSALLNQRLAQESGGRMLLRIEDIDTLRCTPDKVAAVFEDLDWLGLVWEEPVLHQSQRFPAYHAVLDRLEAAGLIYPCFCSRGDIRRAAARSRSLRCDPDGAPLYPGTCRSLSAQCRAEWRDAGRPHVLRLDLAAARPRLSAGLAWDEWEEGPVPVDPTLWGDIVLARKDIPASYHLAVVIDDAMQGVTDVVRGRDLYSATAIHRVVQELIGVAPPRYRHHRLLTDDSGIKLAKSRLSTPLRALRADGVSPADIRRSLGFE